MDEQKSSDSPMTVHTLLLCWQNECLFLQREQKARGQSCKNALRCWNALLSSGPVVGEQSRAKDQHDCMVAQQLLRPQAGGVQDLMIRAGHGPQVYTPRSHALVKARGVVADSKRPPTIDSDREEEDCCTTIVVRSLGRAPNILEDVKLPMQSRTTSPNRARGS